AILVSCTPEEKPAPPPPIVTVIAVGQQSVPVYSEWIGQTRGSQNVEIRARVEGFLERVAYQEGQFVQAGQVMYQIDPSKYRAALSQSQGMLSSAEANLGRATQDVVRYKPLVAENAISREEYETAVSIQRANEATVTAQRGTVEKSRLDLSYCTVTSPISGLAGKTEVQIGNLVGRGDNTLLTTVSKIDPIRVRFSLSEQELLRYRRRLRESGAAATELELTMLLSDGSVHPYKGKLALADNAIDPATGTLLLEAEFPNPDQFLRPGQFARVRAAVQRKVDALLVPQRSITELQGQARVAVVDEKNKVTFRNVLLGPRVGNAYVVEVGLNKGERIVVDGLQKVREGLMVQPKPSTLTLDSLVNKF
ncbi:MAG: efflux RND transporter periplasmic adaptor subunit, partial [Ignavibacteriae bacterium]